LLAERTLGMATIDQKERYRRQAGLCYEIATTMTGERAISMIRLGDAYAALATDPDRLLPNIFASRKKYVDPVCKKCGQKMQFRCRARRSCRRCRRSGAMRVTKR
jgi:hypothetical protein